MTTLPQPTAEPAAMDAVLPLTVRDLGRAELLLRSLRARCRGLGTVWVICPERQRRAIELELRRFAPTIALSVKSELEIVPEFELAPTLSGWYKQQLIKLAISEHVRSPAYLTLDADVLCVKNLNLPQLLVGGRAPCHVIARDLHPDWYHSSEAVLGLRAPRRQVSHNVTPAVLQRGAVLELAEFLRRRLLEGRYASGVRGFKQRLGMILAGVRGRRYAEWRLLLACSVPWTEYALYYTFLEAADRFDRHHYYASQCLYDLEHSLWRSTPTDFAEWTPIDCFRGEGPPFFLVIQSNRGILPERVAEKLGSLLDAA